MLTVIKEKIKSTVINLFYEQMKLKYGRKTFLCVVDDTDKGFIVRVVGDKDQLIVGEKDKPSMVRRACGEYAYMTYGLPQPDEKPITMVLLPTISIFKILGLKSGYQFIKDWHGNSKMGEVTVIEYVYR